MTYRLRNISRRRLAIGGGVTFAVALLIAAIIAAVFVSNRNRLLRRSSTVDPYDTEEGQFASALIGDPGMHCYYEDGYTENSNPKLAGSLNDEHELLWPLRGSIVPECESAFSIDTFDDEREANSAATVDGSGGNGTPIVLPSEKEIAEKGHYSGIRPIHYNLSMNIQSQQDFTGRADMLFRVMEPTDRITVDVDLDALQIAADEITLRQFCSDEAQIRRPIDLCVRRVIKLRRRQAIVIVLNTRMETKERYVLSMGTFRGQPLARPNDPAQKLRGSIGLRLADKDGQAWALTTIFQMRYARTVFPCLDQPTMKARFTVAIEHARGSISASNTPLERTQHVHGQEDRVRDHYRLSPPLAPYVLTFSVMHGYAQFTDHKPNATSIDLYYPDVARGESTYVWIVDETRRVIERIEDSLSFPYGQSKLGFINVNPAPFWGIENYGLVTLESGFSRYPDIERGHTILVHEIIHQWLGDVVTISVWDEICLQEGLTAYFEWRVSEQLPSVQTTLQLQAKRARAENMRKDEMNGMPLIRMYNKTDDIAEVCFGKPPLIFHMIADAYGSTIWEHFLARLLADHPYGNADFETWIRTIIAVTGVEETGEFLRQWFTEPGHPILYVSMMNKTTTNTPAAGRTIKIAQGLVLNGEIVDSPRPRHLPIKILNHDRLSEAIFLNTTENTFPVDSSPARWVLVDPDGATFTRKVYTVSTYKALLDCLPPTDRADLPPTLECRGATRQRVHEAFDDMCFALFKNTFPWGEDRAPRFDRDAWSDLLGDLHEATTMASGQRRLQVDRACECCFRSREELEREASMSAWHPSACKRMWNEMCRNLDVMQMTGRNFTAPDREKNEQQQGRA